MAFLLASFRFFLGVTVEDPYEETLTLLKDNFNLLEALAEKLLENETLDEEEVRGIICIPRTHPLQCNS